MDFKFDKFNHNEKNNPHPQYNIPVYVSKSTGSSEVSFLQILDLTFKIDDLTDWGNLQRLYFKAYVYNLSSDKMNQKIGTLDFYFKINSENTFNSKVRYNAFIEASLNDNTEYFRCYITKNPSSFNVKLYAKITGVYERLRIKPIIYETITNPVDWENPTRNANLSLFEQMEYIFDNFSNRNFTPDTSLPTGSNVTIINDVIQIKKDSTTMTDVLDATDTRFFYLNKPSGSQISSIINGINLQEITLISFNNNTTLKHLNNIKLKNSLDTVIPQKGIIKLIYISADSSWWEVGRSF